MNNSCYYRLHLTCFLKIFMCIFWLAYLGDTITNDNKFFINKISRKLLDSVDRSIADNTKNTITADLYVEFTHWVFRSYYYSSLIQMVCMVEQK